MCTGGGRGRGMEKTVYFETFEKLVDKNVMKH
jgi:hypothetical protein